MQSRRRFSFDIRIRASISAPIVTVLKLHTHIHKRIHRHNMERLLDLFDKADPFSTWWPTIAAVVVGLVITVR